jgi:hypothetical protein
MSTSPDWPAFENLDQSRSGRRLSLWQLAFLLAAVALLLLASFAGWKWYTRSRSLTGRTIVGEHRLSDGSLLVLEQVTFGKRHTFEFPLPAAPTLTRWLGSTSPPQQNQPRFERSTNSDSVVLWFTRWNPETGVCLDFDWWQACLVTDESGDEVEDFAAQRVSWDGSATHSMQAPRPWGSVASTGTIPRVVVATSQLPMLRQHAGARRVRVFDHFASLVAEFQVPFPDTSLMPQWSPDSLPAQRQSEDVAVMFTGISARRLPEPKHLSSIVSHPRPRWVLTPQFSVARNGSLAPDWKPERIDVIDPLGNVANEIENQLSVRESAWKAVITLARDTPAAFAPDEQWTSPLLAIPVGDVSQTPDLRATVQSVALTVVGFGRGKFAYRENVSADEAARQDWHDVPRSELAASPSRGNTALSTWISSTNNGPFVWHCDFLGDLAHFYIKLANAPRNHRELVQIRDDKGRLLPFESRTWSTPDAGRSLLLVAVPPDAGALQLTVFIHTTRTVELFVAPPRPNPSSAPDSAS